jgi:hypothetical protein
MKRDDTVKSEKRGLYWAWFSIPLIILLLELYQNVP